MTFRILTIVVLAAAMGIVIGWCAGRASPNRQTDALVHGNSIYIRALESTMQNSMYDQSDGALIKSLKRGQIADVFNLYRYSDDVNAYLSYENLDLTAHNMAKELLAQMECYSADAYFDKFREVYIHGSDSRYQEAGTQEHESFRKFIETIVPRSTKKRSETTAVGLRLVSESIG